jgi:hypothetical protein
MIPPRHFGPPLMNTALNHRQIRGLGHLSRPDRPGGLLEAAARMTELATTISFRPIVRRR